MPLLFWLAATFILLTIWTALAWLGLGVVGMASEWLLPGVAPTVGTEWTSWLSLAGEGAVVLIWAVGALAIVAAVFALNRVVRVGRALLGGIGSGRRREHLRRPSGRAAFAGRLASRFGPKLLRLARR
jgi:hypothetical protein